MRTASNISVNLIDLSAICHDIESQLLKNTNTLSLDSIIDDGPYGLLVTPEGTYGINKEGIIYGPLDDSSNFMIISFYPKLKTGLLFNAIANLPLNLSSALDLLTKESVPLENFLINFGEETEVLYRNIVQHFSKYYTVKTLIPKAKFKLLTKKDISKYKSFLINDWCECETPINILCSVKAGQCQCGVGAVHSHCKNCGKIIEQIKVDAAR